VKVAAPDSVSNRTCFDKNNYLMNILVVNCLLCVDVIVSLAAWRSTCDAQQQEQVYHGIPTCRLPCLAIVTLPFVTLPFVTLPFVTLPFVTLPSIRIPIPFNDNGRWPTIVDDDDFNREIWNGVDVQGHGCAATAHGCDKENDGESHTKSDRS
jgi:hypothetical protein